MKATALTKHIIVTTRADNKAQALYANALGAQVEVTISNLYSADEVLMIARDVGLIPTGLRLRFFQFGRSRAIFGRNLPKGVRNMAE